VLFRSFEDASKLLGPLQFFLLYRAALTVLTSADRRALALRLILLASVPVSALALLQQAHVGGVPALLADITGSTAYVDNTGVARATGPFPLWHELGSYLLVVVLLGVALMLAGARSVMSPKLVGAVVALAATGVINTASFTPIAGTLAGTFAIVYMERRSRRLIGGLAVAVGVLAILFAPLLDGRYKEQFAAHAPPVKEVPYLPQNFNFRIAVWTHDYLPVLRRHMITGYGPGVPADIRFEYTESVYVTLLLRGGLPLLLIYGGLMLALGAAARALRRQGTAEQQAVARVVYVLVVLIVFLQLTTNYFVNVGFPHLFWLLAALLFAGAGSSAGRFEGRRHPLPPGLARLRRWRPIARGASPGDCRPIDRVAGVADGQRDLVARETADATDPRPPAATAGDRGAGEVDSHVGVSVNTASFEQLRAVESVGTVIAQSIVDWRGRHGAFGTLDDLAKVPGIGQKRLASIRRQVRL